MNIKETLIEIIPIPTTTHKTKAMSEWIIKYLNTIYNQGSNLHMKHDKYGNIYVTKGTSALYPTMVCHIDTVHNLNSNIKAFEHENVLYAMDKTDMTQFGTGGDDKVGIAITLKMLHHFQNFKAVFFLDEEHGCLGSNQCDASFFDNSTIVLQCDRRGNADFVNSISSTKLYGKSLRKKILPYLKKYNRKETDGGITDVGAIAKKNPVMVANMSCGYYNPHTSKETIRMDDVLDTASLCIDILTSTLDKRYAYNRISDRQKTFKFNYHNHNVYSSYGSYGGYYGNNYVKKNPSGYELEEIYNESPETMARIDIPCPNCNSHHVEYDEYSLEVWCHNCGTYIDEYNDIQPITLNNENESTQNRYDQTTFDFESA